MPIAISNVYGSRIFVLLKFGGISEVLDGWVGAGVPHADTSFSVCQVEAKYLGGSNFVCV
jgi:hypothetical protein